MFSTESLASAISVSRSPTGAGGPLPDHRVPLTRGQRVQILAVLIGTITFAELSKDCLFSQNLGDWFRFWQLVYLGMIACLPLLLARTIPKVASFHIQWLPSQRRHWAWFAGMLFLLLAIEVLLEVVWASFEGNPLSSPFVALVIPAKIDKQAILASLFAAPLAEEIFDRGFVLAQLQKLAVSGIAVFVQSLIFAVMHLHIYGLTSRGLGTVAVAFAFAMIAGAWRIRLKSLLPLVLAHILLNTFITCNRPHHIYDQHKGTSEAKIAAYCREIQFDPKDPIKFWCRGCAYLETGEYDKAITDYSQAIQLDPRFAEAYYGRGFAYYQKGAKAKAEADYAQAKKLGYPPELKKRHD